MSLYIESLGQDYPNQVVQIIGGGGSLTGIITSETMNVSSEASTLGADANDVMGFVKGAVKGAVKTIAGEYGASKIDKHFNSVAQSAEGWSSGGYFTPTISFAVFKHSRTGVGLVTDFHALEVALANMTNTASAITDVKQQPTYYSIKDYELALKDNNYGAIERSLYRLIIGDWFNAGLLIPVNTSAEYSTYTTPDGSPLYCNVTISFKSYRHLTARELAGVIQR